MARSIWCKERKTWVDPSTREPLPDKSDGIVALQVVSDLPAYLSPVTGKPVDGRHARREDLKRSGCVPFEPMSNRPRGIASKKRAEKLGRTWDEAAANRSRTQRKSAI